MGGGGGAVKFGSSIEWRVARASCISLLAMLVEMREREREKWLATGRGRRLRRFPCIQRPRVTSSLSNYPSESLFPHFPLSQSQFPIPNPCISLYFCCAKQESLESSATRIISSETSLATFLVLSTLTFLDQVKQELSSVLEPTTASLYPLRGECLLSLMVCLVSTLKILRGRNNGRGEINFDHCRS